jgi:toxin-antitoxin system PIN domain toxin
MILLDVNVLVYAHRQDVSRHAEYRAFLEAALDGPEGCAVSELVLSGCLRILTHPKVFNPPSPLSKALNYVNAIREHPNAVLVSPGPRHWGIFVDLCRRAEGRGNLVSDAYHAALAIESGCEWITTDRDYSRFSNLRWRHPLED